MGVSFQYSWAIKTAQWAKNPTSIEPLVAHDLSDIASTDIPSPEKPIASSPIDFVFEFPNEIQHIIFTTAATDARCARELSLVSRYVRNWVVPVMYERLVIHSPQAALCLLETVRSKPRGYFRDIVKSLAFDYPVQLRYAKPLLAECSHSLISMTCFTMSDNQHSCLPFVRSPHLRRLTLIHKPNFARPIPREAPYNAVTPEVMTSLTHLTIIINYPHGLWRNLYFASMAQLSDADKYRTAYASFQNLTHFAISHSRWMSAIPIKQIAKNLRYFVVLEPARVTRLVHSFLVITTSKFQDRRLLLVRDCGDPESWDPEDCWVPSSFWSRVEQFVDQGYLSDQGDRWLDHLKPSQIEGEDMS